jgi:hypothetical protein
MIKVPYRNKSSLYNFIIFENFHTTMTLNIKNMPLIQSENRLYDRNQWDGYMKSFEENGYVVIPGVTKEYAKTLENGFFDWFEGFSPDVKRSDPSTWVGEGRPSTIHGIFKNFGIGHIQPIWDAREKCAHIFQDYWNTPHVLTSFDGACLLRPNMKPLAKDWLHTDQGAKLKVTQGVSDSLNYYSKHTDENGHRKFVCVQGVLNLVDCGDDDGGLYVAVGSHKKHAQFFKDTNQSQYSQNWYPYGKPSREKDESDLKYQSRCISGELYLEQFKKVKVNAKAGDFILFYSTLAHQAVPTKKDNKTHRLAFYISMLPYHLATQSELKKRSEALCNLRTTSHWACLGFKLNGEFPRNYGDSKIIQSYPRDKVKLPKLTHLMYEMAGVKFALVKSFEFKGLRTSPTLKRKESESDETEDDDEEDEMEKKKR